MYVEAHFDGKNYFGMSIAPRTANDMPRYQFQEWPATKTSDVINENTSTIRKRLNDVTSFARMLDTSTLYLREASPAQFLRKIMSACL